MAEGGITNKVDETHLLSNGEEQKKNTVELRNGMENPEKYKKDAERTEQENRDPKRQNDLCMKNGILHKEQKKWKENGEVMDANSRKSNKKSTDQNGTLSSQETFDKRKGTKMHGQMYEVKMTTLIFLKLINLGYSFYLCSNLNGAGDFDDIVVKYTKKDYTAETLFIQLKHAEKDDTIRPLSFVRKDTFFDLHKYFTSVCNSPVFKDTDHKIFSTNIMYIIITNAKLQHDNILDNVEGVEVSYDVCGTSQREDILKICKYEGYEVFCDLLDKANKNGRGGYNKGLLGKVRQKTIENDKLMNILKPLKDALEEMNKLENINTSGFNDFISKTRLLHKQKSNKDLDKTIKEEIKKALRTSRDDTNIVFALLICEMVRWHDEMYYLTEKWDQWNKIKNKYYRGNM